MQSEIYLKRVEQHLIEQGFENFSMDRLAAMTGTTKRTLYNNFESREDLFECLTDMQRERIRTATLPLYSEYGINAIEIFRKWYSYNINFLTSLQQIYLPSLRIHMPHWYELFCHMMERNCREFTALLVPRGRDEGLFIRNFDSDSFAIFIHRILATSTVETAKEDIAFLSRSICTLSRQHPI